MSTTTLAERSPAAPFVNLVTKPTCDYPDPDGWQAWLATRKQADQDRPTSQDERSGRAKAFDVLRRQIDIDPVRREKVDEHKKAMLADVRRQLDLTQVIVAERLAVSQANVSQIERGDADVRLSTLGRYVEALGGRLEVRAVFPDRSVELDVGKSRRRPRRAS